MYMFTSRWCHNTCNTRRQILYCLYYYTSTHSQTRASQTTMAARKFRTKEGIAGQHLRSTMCDPAFYLRSYLTYFRHTIWHFISHIGVNILYMAYILPFYIPCDIYIYNILSFYVTYYSSILSGISLAFYSAIYLTFYFLTFYLAGSPTFYLELHLTFHLTYSLKYSEMFCHSIWYLASYSIWHFIWTFRRSISQQVPRYHRLWAFAPPPQRAGAHHPQWQQSFAKQLLFGLSSPSGLPIWPCR